MLKCIRYFDKVKGFRPSCDSVTHTRESRLWLTVLHNAIRFSVPKAGIMPRRHEPATLVLLEPFRRRRTAGHKSLDSFIADFFLHNLTHMHNSYDVKKSLKDLVDLLHLVMISVTCDKDLESDIIPIVFTDDTHKLKILPIFVFVEESLMALYRFRKMLTRLTAVQQWKLHDVPAALRSHVYCLCDSTGSVTCSTDSLAVTIARPVSLSQYSEPDGTTMIR